MKLIPLSTTKRTTTKNKEMFAKVDDDKFDYLMQWKWYAVKSGNTYYATRAEIINGKEKYFRMHRVILGLNFGDKRVADHRDFCGLNNQGVNLRICTRGQNATYARQPKTEKSKTLYRGVTIKRNKRFNKTKQIWVFAPIYFRAMIKVNQKMICLGHYKDQLSAAKAYNAGAIKYHGEFAILNDV